VDSQILDGGPPQTHIDPLLPSKKKTMHAKVSEGQERSENVEEGRKKLDWVEEWKMAQDRRR
jgi:hypothetical protein